jgi:large subunit ribosomal protein L17
MYRNLITSLLRHDAITTTEAKAKEIQGMAERLITLGKRGDLHARRLALTTIADKKVIDKLFGEIAHKYPDRAGGYTRILKLGTRPGDGAFMARIELV